MNKQKTLAYTGIIAALYVVINTVLGGASFGPIQMRVSNTLYQLVAFNKKFYFGLVLGVFIANMFSPLGWYDLVFGVGTTVLGLGVGILVNKKVSNQLVKQIVIAAFVTLATLLVAIELHMVFGVPILMTWLTVGAGQLVSQVIGIFLIRAISKRFDLTK